LNGAEKRTRRDCSGDQKDQSDGCTDDWVMGCEPCEADGYSVFRCAEGDVGNRLRAWSDSGAESSLRSMRGECDGGTEGSGEDLHLRRELRGSVVGDQRRDGQMRSKPGILSAMNSMPNMTAQTTMTQVCPRESSPGGNATHWVRARMPRVSTVA